ncbi:MAG: methyltransferase domain-containing protein [Planctomycetaceae bacterium]
MKLRHFEALQPVCPVCRSDNSFDNSRLTIGAVWKSDDTAIFEGVLLCPNTACQREFPIIDGIPLIIPHIRSFIESGILQIFGRDDLSEATESMLTDCCGPGSAFESVRQHVSSYTWDHYAEFDPADVPGADKPGLVVNLLDRCLEMADSPVGGPVLDLGCGVGRTSFAMAERTGELVVGADLHYAMLRIASRVLSTGQVRYPRRRVGIVYDRREFPVSFPRSENVDFWGCDANALPFRDGQFATTVSLNVLDCSNSPMNFLKSIERVTATGGQAILACPYDWSAGATPIEAWLGGHSQRSPTAGASDAMLRSMLTPGSPMHSFPRLSLAAELDDLPWHVRLHDRSTMHYRTHGLVIRVSDPPPAGAS